MICLSLNVFVSRYCCYSSTFIGTMYTTLQLVMHKIIYTFIYFMLLVFWCSRWNNKVSMNRFLIGKHNSRGHPNPNCYNLLFGRYHRRQLFHDLKPHWFRFGLFSHSPRHVATCKTWVTKKYDSESHKNNVHTFTWLYIWPGHGNKESSDYLTFYSVVIRCATVHCNNRVLHF